MDIEVRKLRKSIGISQEQFAYSLGVSVRTISRWEKLEYIQSPIHARFMKSIEDLINYALEVLQPEKVLEWFRTPNNFLNDKSPLQILKEPDGIERVKGLLGRIEWGIPG